jgi:hypothetical protein
MQPSVRRIQLNLQNRNLWKQKKVNPKGFTFSNHELQT